MQKLRRSISVGLRSRESEDDVLVYGDQITEAPVSQKSVDNFVIPGRTRYPSSTTTEPQLLDFRVAEELLKTASKTPSATYEKFGHSGVHPVTISSNVESKWPRIGKCSPYDVFRTPFDSKPNSRVVSSATVSDASSLSFSHPFFQVHTPQTRATDNYVENYNALAMENHLQNVSAMSDTNEDMVAAKADERTTSPPRNSLWARLVRSSSSSSSMKKYKSPQLGHKLSVRTLISLVQRSNLRCRTLDETYLLGGVSMIQLPSSHTATDLVVPTYLAATANYLALHGRDASGIFRVPGQSSTVNALYDYYAQQIQSTERATGSVHATVGSNELPPQIHCTIHDVASAFKRFLWDIPGGILGSVPLFNSLREISYMHEDKDDSRCVRNQAKLTALALLCLKSQRRIALISSVFGLLALLRREDADYSDPLNGALSFPIENMNAKALGVIFAPLLLGSLTEKIDIQCTEASPRLQIPCATSKRGIFRHRKSPEFTSGFEQSPSLAIGMKQTSAAAFVIEMLVRNWQVIVEHMRALQTDRKPLMRSSSSPSVNHPSVSQQPLTKNSYGSSANVTKKYMQRKGSVDQTSNSNLQSERSDERSELISEVSVPNARRGIIANPDINTRHELSILDAVSVTSNIEQQPDSRMEDLNVAYPLNLHRIAPTTYWDTPKTPLGGIEALAWWEKKAHTNPTSHKGRLNASTFSSGGAEGPESPTSSVTQTRRSSSIVDTPIPCSVEVTTVEDEINEPHSQDFSRDDALDICLTLDLPAVNRPQEETENQPLAKDGAAPLVGIDRTMETQGTSNGLVPHFATMTKPIYTPLGVCFHTIDGINDVERGCSDMVQTQKLLSKVVMPRSSHLQNSVISSDGKYENTPRPLPRKRSPSMIPKPIRAPGHGQDVTKYSFNNQSSIRHHHPASAPPPEIQQRQPSNSAQLCDIQSISEQWKPQAYTRPALVEENELEHVGHKHAIGLRAQNMFPPADLPPIARCIDFKYSQDNHRPISKLSSKDTQANDASLCQPDATTGPRENVGTLYKELRKLNKELDSKLEENWQLHQQLDAMRRFRSSGTLSEQLREKEREIWLWKRRAEWAETALFGRSETVAGIRDHSAASESAG